MITSTLQTWRVYFNLHGAFPLVWCISDDEGTFEMLVQHVDMFVSSCVVYRKKDQPDSEDDRPSGWVECYGVLSLDNGRATIRES